MKNGYLSQYFEAVAVKTLSAVEIDKQKSHQHEFNGTRELKHVIKTPERKSFSTKFLWMDESELSISETGTVTWYDARENHQTRSEYRLYFADNEVMNAAKSGDSLFIAKRTDDTLLIIVTPSDTTIENQLYWLFGLNKSDDNSFGLSEISNNDQEINFVTRFILDELNIEIKESESEVLDALLKPFKNEFPSTAVFSNLVCDSVPDKLDLIEEPDAALLFFMNWEEKLFRRLEHHIVSERIVKGFVKDGVQDVDSFISFSLSVQNRRKSRAGHAFEFHFRNILKANSIIFSAGAQTENRSKPDFIFPNISLYHDLKFPNELLTLLGAKTTCKDRWRQVLSESSKISNKHLLTLEPSISEHQTDEMKSSNLQLVIPQKIHSTYNTNQQKWLMNVKDFIRTVGEKQRSSYKIGYLK